MRAAYRAETALAAQAQLENLAGELEHPPSAAAYLREGLEETLSVLRLGVPPTLARSLRSTSCVESMIEITRDHSRNVKRWRSGHMALRWCAAGMVEARAQFRRVIRSSPPAGAAGSPRTACRSRKRQPPRQQ